MHFVQIPKDSFSASDGAILLKFTDQSKTIMVEQMRSDFISNASHELRTPLASIIGFIETIQGHAKNDKANRELFLSTYNMDFLIFNVLIQKIIITLMLLTIVIFTFGLDKLIKYQK